MKKILRNLIWVIVLFFACSEKKTGVTALENSNFNEKASAAFLRENANRRIIPLDKYEECVLRQSIENDLDSIEKWSNALSPSIELRYYYMDHLSFDFYFARSGRDKFYFIAFPELYETMYNEDEYNNVKDGLFYPKDSCEILRVSTSYLDEFLKNEIQPEELDKIIPIIFKPVFRYRITTDEFLEKSEKVTAKSTVPRLSQILQQSANEWVFDINMIGFILVTKNSLLHNFDVYFVPYNGRHQISTDNRSCSNCQN